MTTESVNNKSVNDDARTPEEMQEEIETLKKKQKRLELEHKEAVIDAKIEGRNESRAEYKPLLEESRKEIEELEEKEKREALRFKKEVERIKAEGQKEKKNELEEQARKMNGEFMVQYNGRIEEEKKVVVATQQIKELEAKNGILEAAMNNLKEEMQHLKNEKEEAERKAREAEEKTRVAEADSQDSRNKLQTFLEVMDQQAQMLFPNVRKAAKVTDEEPVAKRLKLDLRDQPTTVDGPGSSMLPFMDQEALEPLQQAQEFANLTPVVAPYANIAGGVETMLYRLDHDEDVKRIYKEGVFGKRDCLWSKDGDKLSPQLVDRVPTALQLFEEAKAHGGQSKRSMWKQQQKDPKWERASEMLQAEQDKQTQLGIIAVKDV